MRDSELKQLVGTEDQDELLPCWERKYLPEIRPTALTIPSSGATCTRPELGKIAMEKYRRGTNKKYEGRQHLVLWSTGLNSLG